jgi:benzylsuccinate CoA-transferase BbsE subunit
MPGAQNAPAALAGIKVLDLTTNSAAYAGRLLTDLGADVIRVEPPGGSPVRKLEPSETLPDGGSFSFAQAFFDAGKRSVVLDVNTQEGSAAYRHLISTSDIIIETPEHGGSTPGLIDFLAARKQNPRLIVASITPYGFGGPYAERRATDLTLLASGGLLSFGGYADGEPLGVHGEQAYLASAIFGAVGILTALLAREETGKGQWIDVSAQECIAFALEDAVPEWYINKKVRRRNGDRAREAGTGIYPCSDGYISMVAGRLGTAKAFITLTEWVADAGHPRAKVLLEPQWKDFKYRQSAEGIAMFAGIFGEFCGSRSKEELYREGQARQIAVAPVNSIADLTGNVQLAASHYFRKFAEPALGKELIFPGSPYRLSRTPAWQRSRAPSLGEHTGEILAAANLSVPSPSVVAPS